MRCTSAQVFVLAVKVGKGSRKEPTLARENRGTADFVRTNFFQVFFFIYLTYPYFNHEKTVQLSHHLVMIISWPGKTKILKNVG